MRAFLRSAITTVSFIALAGCAPAASNSHPANTPTTTMAAPASSEAPDLSPVAEPSGVVLVARARNLTATLGSAERMARIPLSVENEIRKMLREENADVFKLDAGVDLVVALDPESKDDDPKFLAAVSLPISDLEQTRAALEREGRDVMLLVPGVYRAKVRDSGEEKKSSKDENDGPPDDYDIEDRAPKKAYCDLAASVGDASARIVCSDRAEELDLLRPWLTRGLPTTPLVDNDFYSEVRFGPFRDRYLPVARAQLPGVEFLAKQWMDTELNIREPRLLAIPGQLMQEGLAFLDDLDRISLAGKLDPSASEMSFKGKVSFRNKTAWLTQVYTDSNDEAGMPPDIFWRLPREADSASYARSADPKLYEGVRDTLRLLVSDLLTQTPLSAASKSSVEAFLAAAPTSKVTVVTARGTNPFKGLYQSKKQPSSKPPTARDAIRELENVVNASMGWSIVGVDAPAAEYADWIKKGVAAYDRVLRDAKNDKGIGKEIKDAKWIPSMRVRNNVAGYPRGSMGVDVTVRFDSKQIWDYTIGKVADAPEHPKGPAENGSITLQIVVVPDGANRAWIGMSTDTKLLKEKMSVVLTPGGRDTTIASLPGLEALRSTPTIAAGYFTYGNLLTQTLEAIQKESSVDPETVKKVVATLPNRLTTPILLLHTATAGSAPTNEIEFRVQRGSVEDIAGFVQFAFSPEGRKLIEQLEALDSTKDKVEAVEAPAE